jgi:hypothetical protein
MTIDQVNSQLRNKRPAAKAPVVAANAKIHTAASLRVRIAVARKNAEAAYNKAHELKAWKQMAPLHMLVKALAELEATLNRISNP